MAQRQTTKLPQKGMCILAFFGFCALAFIMYRPALHGPFIWDDGVMVYDNANVRSANGLLSIWSGHDIDYLPVTSSVFWIEWRLFGTEPAGYRLINILLHATSSFLLWRILSRLKIPGAGIAATIFCVHPVCVATVAWIAELKNTLSLCLALAATLFFLRSRPTDAKAPAKTSNLTWYIAALVAFALALLSKISVVMLPFAFLALVDWRKRTGLLKVVPFFLLSLLCGLLNVWFQNHRAMATVQATDVAPMLSRVVGAGYALWFYCAKVLLPINLMPIYPHWNGDPRNAFSWLPLVSWILVLATAWFVARKSPVWRVPWLGLLFFTITAIPALGLVPISFLLQTQVADHLQYFPMLGLVTFIAFGIAKAVTAFKNKPEQGNATSTIVIACIIIILGVPASARSALYSRPENLWRDNVQKNPSASMAWANLADVSFNQSRYQEASDYYAKSLKVDPDNLLVREQFANCLNTMGRPAEALEQLRIVVAKQPDSGHVHNNIGSLLLALGQLPEAVREFQTAVKIAPSNESTHFNLGYALARLGKVDEAVTQFNEVLRLNPGNEQARVYLNQIQQQTPNH